MTCPRPAATTRRLLEGQTITLDNTQLTASDPNTVAPA
jgi:hypothetical protein